MIFGDKYELIDRINKGAFGSIIKVMNIKNNNQIYALKFIEAGIKSDIKKIKKEY